MKTIVAFACIALVFGSLHAFPRGSRCPEGAVGCDDQSFVPEQIRKEARDCLPCPRIYMPVCGSDGSEVQTFSNECMMKFVNCEEHRAFSMLRSGECEV